MVPDERFEWVQHSYLMKHCGGAVFPDGTEGGASPSGPVTNVLTMMK
jgi:hypothetical protein